MTKRKRSLIAAVAFVGASLLGGVASSPAHTAADCRAEKCVALVFEGGPGPHTGALLDTLADEGAPATFFVTGRVPAFRHPELVRRMGEEGHEVGNGTWTRPRLTDVPAKEARRQLAQTQRVLTQVTGHRPTLVRPPHGVSNAQVAAICRSLGLTQVLGGVPAAGHGARDDRAVVERALDGAAPGATVVLDDSNPAVVAALPALVEGLRDREYVLVTASRLPSGGAAARAGL
ncbi:polysaccharide deacetylase family protein [Streptomyces sp. NPDC058657]|uniref:polysaccharide deacetylase family protein n=1 Tax=unclassified Streptomyces TaxID=2593676 RepID=UPI003665A33C